ncbi:hypothetical protein ANCCEY_04400 [Ancylostoma ceylanicum]|uniref:NTR domain-containing protein n=1 Tax=Ancylostoma ceylanicum TaxID=53326 RepID=A0A0D6LWS0_9BILA|nr:hypothetical protein ANCCEY_04400 [Ancylostoma ceylanicum]
MNVSLVTWARVLNITGDLQKPEEPWKYTIWHLRTWKGYEKVKDNSTSVLTTSSSYTACGLVGLQEEEEYILAGRMGDNGEISITSCDLALPYRQAYPEDMELLRNLKYETKKCESS